MGIEDRDYYQKDRKKVRTQKLNRKDVYYHPKEFRKGSKLNSERPSNDWSKQDKIRRPQWAVLIAFVAGSFVTFWMVMVILHVKSDLLWVPFKVVRKILNIMGVFL